MTASTLALFKLRGVGEGVKQRVTIEASPLTFTAGGRRAFGGADSARSPIDFAQITGQIVANSNPAIALGRWEIVVKASIHQAVLIKDGDGLSNFRDVDLAVSVQTNLEPDAFARFAREVDERCPVAQLFRRSGVGVTTRWTAKQLAKAGAELTRLAS
jgi:putative redox protein